MSGLQVRSRNSKTKGTQMRGLSASLIGSLGFLLLGTSAWALTCPTGKHSVCHGGSGRGGEYHTTCSCVNTHHLLALLPGEHRFRQEHRRSSTTPTTCMRRTPVVPIEPSLHAI